MKLLPALAAAGATALMLASSSVANVPEGKGLELVPASPVGVFCEDGSAPYSVLLTRSTAPSAWRIEVDDHYVLSFFSITTYFNGVVVSTESKSWGQKAGIDSISCWGGFEDGPLRIAIASTTHLLP
jgi:hypothetical protein